MSTINLLSVPPELLSPILKYVVEGEGNLACRLVSKEVRDVVDFHVIPYLWKKLKENAGLITAIDLKAHITQIEMDSPNGISLAAFQALYQKILTVYPLKSMPIMFPPFLEMQSNLDESLLKIWAFAKTDLPNSNGLTSAKEIRSYLNNSENEQAFQRVLMLALKSSKLKAIPPEINKFRNLEDIFFTYNELKNIPDLSGLTKIKHLALNNNQIMSVKSLSDLITLVTLDLDENKISNIKNLSNLTTLVRLDLNENEISNVKNLSNLDKLQRLCLSSNKINNLEGLEHLTNLKILYLKKNYISSVKDLSTLTNLQSLHFEGNLISPEERLKLTSLKNTQVYY